MTGVGSGGGQPTPDLAALAEQRLQAVVTSPRQQPLHPVVVEAKKKFYTVLEDELLDFKHNNPLHIEGAANTLLKIFGNVLEHPLESKYRQVKTSSNMFKTTVQAAKGGEHLLQLAGWKTSVVNMEKFYVFDGEPGSHKWQIMEEAAAMLRKGLGMIHEKAERKRREAEEKAALEKSRKEAVRLALEDDKQGRQVRNEYVAAGNVAGAQAGPPAAVAYSTGPRGSAGALQGMDDDDDDEDEEQEEEGEGGLRRRRGPRGAGHVLGSGVSGGDPGSLGRSGKSGD